MQNPVSLKKSDPRTSYVIKPIKRGFIMRIKKRTCFKTSDKEGTERVSNRQNRFRGTNGVSDNPVSKQKKSRSTEKQGNRCGGKLWPKGRGFHVLRITKHKAGKVYGGKKEGEEEEEEAVAAERRVKNLLRKFLRCF